MYSRFDVSAVLNHSRYIIYNTYYIFTWKLKFPQPINLHYVFAGCTQWGHHLTNHNRDLAYRDLLTNQEQNENWSDLLYRHFPALSTGCMEANFLTHSDSCKFCTYLGFTTKFPKTCFVITCFLILYEIKTSRLTLFLLLL